MNVWLWVIGGMIVTGGVGTTMMLAQDDAEHFILFYQVPKGKIIPIGTAEVTLATHDSIKEYITLQPDFTMEDQATLDRYLAHNNLTRNYTDARVNEVLDHIEMLMGVTRV
jgi:hypothetical protein